MPFNGYYKQSDSQADQAGAQTAPQPSPLVRYLPSALQAYPGQATQASQRAKSTQVVPPQSPLIPLLPTQAGSQSPSSGAYTPARPSAQPSGTTPTTLESPYYTAGFLRHFIGQNMRIEFLMGTSGALIDRTGTLVEVGASYVVIQPFQSDDLLMCDLYSIKFITIYG